MESGHWTRGLKQGIWRIALIQAVSCWHFALSYATAAAMHTVALNPFDAAAILIVLTAVLAYFNHRVLRLPSSVGMTLMGAVASLLVISVDYLLPARNLSGVVTTFLAGIDFETTLMDGMLSFLLFAGALHVDWGSMKKGRWAILALSTIGVMLSTLIVGSGFYLATSALGLPLRPSWCFVFGALISPTDPVAVMGVLKRVACPPTALSEQMHRPLITSG